MAQLHTALQYIDAAVKEHQEDLEHLANQRAKVIKELEKRAEKERELEEEVCT